MQEPVIKYIEAGQADLETARLLIENNKNFYTPFLCHQALQKILRGCFLEYLNRYPPLTNDLLKIADDTEAGLMMEEADRKFVSSLSIYPDVIGNPVYRMKILEDSNGEKAVKMLEKTNLIFQILKKLI